MPTGSGKVVYVKVKEIDAEKNFGNQYRYVVGVEAKEGEKATFFMAGVGNGTQVKAGTDKKNMQPIAKGDIITFIYREEEDKRDPSKVWRKINRTTVEFEKKSDEEPYDASNYGGGTSQQSYSGGKSEGKGGFKGNRDNTGMETGHAINGALYLKNHKIPAKGIGDSAKEVHVLTKTLKEEYKKVWPHMSEYDLGACVGHAILNGCKATTSVDKAEEFARKVLEEVGDVQEFIKSGGAGGKKDEKKAEDKPAAKEDDAPFESEEDPFGDDLDDF